MTSQTSPHPSIIPSVFDSPHRRLRRSAPLAALLLAFGGAAAAMTLSLRSAFAAEKETEEGPHADEAEAPEMVLLDEIAIRNLRLEFAEVSDADFEESVFALGRIEAIPSHQAAVSSRIAGRLVAIHVTPGDSVAAGAEVVVIESRQPGDPPPTVSLPAPLGGLVTAMGVRLGDPVSPDTRIAEITDLSQVFAVARVPEHQVGRLQPGTTRARLRVAALPGESFEADLLRFGPGADTASGTVDAVFRLPNQSGLLRPGMRAEFSIVVDTEQGVMSVPREALQGTASDRHVYVQDFELANAFLKAPVVVGRRNDRAVEILSGLLPGDTVVTRGAYSLAFAGGGNMSLKEALD
ncbi:MAG TPA: efflux RND transporter periplasmic adaptor subunit, partial [Longimicrobiaceae bacterium]|nr:efflux RND transporter periplasmic adaptor subunit [Longimicrobiaceae bacterium]